MEAVADLLEQDVDIVLTHGNGPQVGNLLVKNELAAAVVPPVPLDWCGASTQATLGFVLMEALDVATAERGIYRRSATLVTRTLVDADDPGFTQPTKPIGRSLSAEEAALLIDHGEHWEDRGEQGWRRVVASPEPRAILDAPAVRALVDAGSSSSPTAAVGSRWCATRTGCAASRRSSTRISGPRCWPGPSTPTSWSSPPTSPRRCSTSAPPRPNRSAGDTVRLRELADGGPLRQRLDGAEGGRRLQVRRAGRPVRRDHRPRQHRQRRDRPEDEREGTVVVPPDRETKVRATRGG